MEEGIEGSQVALLQNGKLGEEGADYLQTKKTTP